MNDAMIEAVYGQQPTPSVAPLIVLMLVLAMLVLACVIVALERKIQRGDFSAGPPAVRLRPRYPNPRGFAVVIPQQQNLPPDPREGKLTA